MARDTGREANAHRWHKTPCTVAQAIVGVPGVSIAHSSGDKPLVLCQPGSQGTLLACSSCRRWGSPYSLGRSTYQSVSLVVVGIEVHAWAVLRLPSFHEMSAATQRRNAAFQPVLTRYKLLYIEAGYHSTRVHLQGAVGSLSPLHFFSPRAPAPAGGRRALPGCGSPSTPRCARRGTRRIRGGC